MKDKTSYCGIHLEGNRLFLFFQHQQIVLDGWPTLKAWQRDTGGLWKSYNPQISIEDVAVHYIADRADRFFRCQTEKVLSAKGCPATIIRDTESRFGYESLFDNTIDPVNWHLDNQEAIQKLLNGFFESIPSDVATGVSPLVWNQWHFLKWARDYEPFNDLLRINPALALAVCHASRFVPLGGRKPKAFFMNLMQQKQRKIAAFLGFPDSEAVATILKRVSPDLLRVHELLILREILTHDKEFMKRLFHVQTINAAVMCLLYQSESVRESVTATFLSEVAVRFPRGEEIIGIDKGFWHQCGYDYNRLTSLLTDLVYNRGPVRITSIEALEKLHDRMRACQ